LRICGIWYAICYGVGHEYRGWGVARIVGGIIIGYGDDACGDNWVCYPICFDEVKR